MPSQNSHFSQLNTPQCFCITHPTLLVALPYDRLGKLQAFVYLQQALTELQDRIWLTASGPEPQLQALFEF